jgi:hypothetical protein
VTTARSARDREVSVAKPELELTILIPCLDEAATVGTCVEKAIGYLRDAGIGGEVLVADNGSSDRSATIARQAGARVVHVSERGYGNALRAGIAAASGRYVIMGDADDSYDFRMLDDFVAELRRGHQVVIGNRFKGGIAPGAMPALHRYLGNPLLSAIGRRFFGITVGDFHCGLRGFDRRAVLVLDLRTTGMEFASEMVVKAALAGLSIVEVPTTLGRDGRNGSSHLRSWRDGWRHLLFLLIYSPRWLFLYPGLIAMAVGGVATAVLVQGTLAVGRVEFDIASLIYAAALLIVGYQAVLFWLITKVYAAQAGFLPMTGRSRARIRSISVERGLLAGFCIFVAGLFIGLAELWRWNGQQFGRLDPSQSIRAAVPAMLGLVLGSQTTMYAMFVGILGIPTQYGNPSSTTAIAAVHQAVEHAGDDGLARSARSVEDEEVVEAELEVTSLGESKAV